jgi:hypothetical protein
MCTTLRLAVPPQDDDSSDDTGRVLTQYSDAQEQISTSRSSI